jgi:uncharacterized GH25 family protein
MKKSHLHIALAVSLFASSGLASAHQIWIEQAVGEKTASVRFGEFGENLRETSPGLLDKFGKPKATLLSTKGEQSVDAVKSAKGLSLPFGAAGGESIVAEDPSYPLYNRKQGDESTLNRYYPAARLITSFAAQQPKLSLDLVPTGKPGEFKLFLKGQPKAKTKVTLVTQSGWAKEGKTDEQGVVSFDMPWKGTYVAEVSVNERGAGERPGANGPEKFESVSYVTTLTYVKADGMEPLPAPPAATPAK